MLRFFFCKLIVKFMTDTIISALADSFAKQQSNFDKLAEVLKIRQQTIDNLQTVYATSQDQLAALQQQLLSDSQISDLNTKIQSSNQELTKLLTQVQSVKPALNPKNVVK